MNQQKAVQVKKKEVEDSLFELLNSMSSSEKRYFKARVKRNVIDKENYPDYYYLYHILIKRKEYDEKEVLNELLKKLGKTGCSNFTVKKDELYNALMKYLKNYHFRKKLKTSDYSRVLLQESNFLFKRGLYRQAFKKINMARRVAVKCGDTLCLIELNRWEREYLRTNRVVKMEKRLTELHEEEDRLLNDLKIEAEMNKAYDILVAKLFTKTRLTDEKSIKILKSEFGHLESLLDKRKDLPIQAQRFLVSGLVSYFTLIGDEDKAGNSIKLVFEWWKEQTLWKEKMPHYYISALSNVLTVYNREKKHDKFLEILDILEKLSFNTEHEKTVRFHLLMNQRLMYFLNVGLITEACNLSKRIEKGLKEYKLNEGKTLTLMYNTIVAHFFNEDFIGCNRWIAMTTPFKKKGRGNLKIQMGQIFKLISFYELEDMDNFEKTYKSVLRFFSLRMGLESSDFEIVFLKYIYELNNALPSDRKRTLIEIKNEIETSFNSYKRTGIEELLFWVNSKLENRSMKDLLLEQIRNKP